MSLTATIAYPYDERILKLFEAENKTFDRTAYRVEHLHGKIVFAITAQDATALRAAMTTITKILSVWEATQVHERA